MLKKFLIGTVVALVLLVGVTASAADFGTTTLKVGSKGEFVKALQTLVGASVDGSFGPMTKAKVMVWQQANGLVADGLFGNMSKAKANGAVSGNFPVGCTSASGFSSTTGLACVAIPSTVAGCASGALFSATTGASCAGAVSTGPLTGAAGEISTVTKLSQYSSEEVGAGQNDVKILGFEVKASKDGDIGIHAAKVVFTITNASGSTKLADYVDTVTVWQGSTKVASVDAIDFNKDSTGIYSKTVALSGSVVREDSTEKFYVTIDAVSNLDSADIDTEVFKVGIDSIRIIDGSGISTTDTTTGDLQILLVPVDFVSYSTAANTELKISAASSPIAGVVKVSTTADTNDVVLLKGKMVLDGTSDVWLDELPVNITSTGGYIDALANSVSLTIDGKTFTESLGTNCVDQTDFATTDNCGVVGEQVVIFDNLDLTITAGDTINFTVSADLNDLEAGAAAIDFTAGDSLLASVTTAGRAFIVAENEEGDQLAAAEITGSATGYAQTFRSEGVNVVMGTVVLTPTTVVADGTVTKVSYTIPLTVTSFGETLYVGQTAELVAVATASNAFAFVFQNSTAPTASDVTSTTSYSLSTSDATVVTNGYELTDGVAKHFTLQVDMTVPTTGANSYRVAIKQLRTFTDASLSAGAVNNDLTPIASFQTGYQYITS